MECDIAWWAQIFGNCGAGKQWDEEFPGFINDWNVGMLELNP